MDKPVRPRPLARFYSREDSGFLRGASGLCFCFCPQRQRLMRLYHFNPFSPLILLLILVVNAAAQFDTGTVIIVGYSHDKIIVVAESRQAGEKGEHFDNGCKITALNDKFFFTAS